MLSRNTLCFETKNYVDREKIPLPLEYNGNKCNFGVLNIQATTVNETTDELDFLFVIDCSGSMSDMCADGRTKMQHIIHTLKNMILFLTGNKNMNVNITINAFDSKWYSIVPRIRLTDENHNEILKKINNIQPNGSTNIEFALTCAAEQIGLIQTLYPDNRINHIFMTDGEATCGSTNFQLLRGLVSQSVSNAFIGFGINHDSALLNSLSVGIKSEYYFIDKLENAGLVYGEILHSIVYKVLKDVTIYIENGMIYDYKNNSWTNTLEIGDIVSEANKFYNIVSDDYECCSAKLIDGNSDIYSFVKEDKQDLTIHMFRQRTLQLLYEANLVTNNNRSNNYHPVQKRMNTEDCMKMKEKLTHLMNEMKQYMDQDQHQNQYQHQDQNNKFIKNLCDDIYICHRTFGTKYGGMYCSARQRSQGTQRQYTVSAPPLHNDGYFDSIMTQNMFSHRTPVRRNLYRSIGVLNDNIENENHINDDPYSIFDRPTIVNTMFDHDLSDFTSSPYLTAQATQVMRFVSSGMNKSNENDDDVEEIM